MHEEERRPAGNRAATTANNTHDGIASRQVSWWSVREYVTEALDRAGSWPMAGTPVWCKLADDDPAKMAALLDAAQHWALRVEIAQHAVREASRDVAGAADWRAIADDMQRRGGSYIPARRERTP